MLRESQDAFGHAFLDCLNGDREAAVTIDRDDGLSQDDVGCRVYFGEYDEWSPHLKKAIEYARGRVLDVGCGAGRHSLYLQGKGHEVVGIDESALAVQICRTRGVVDARQMSLTQLSSKLGVFDTVLMMGNNFGLVSNPTRARWFLKRLHSMTSSEARIIAETLDPCATSDPRHLAYHERNRQRGRLPGQVRIRVAYKQYRTSWFDLLLVTRAELEAIVQGTGWRIGEYVDSGGPGYVAVIVKVAKG